MPQDNATHRSFASLRMTNDAIPVILSAAKDLYESSRDYILQIHQLSVKNLFYTRLTGRRITVFSFSGAVLRGSER